MEAGGVNVNPLCLLDLGDNARNIGNVVYYNARDNVIEVRDNTIQGGFMQLYGNIINTDRNNGKLQVLDGFGRASFEFGRSNSRRTCSLSSVTLKGFFR